MANNIYKVDENYLVKSLLPPDKRQPIHTSWLEALNSQMQFINDKDVAYIYGSTYSSWTSSATYSLGARVFGGLTYNNNIFQSTTNLNHNNQLSNSNYWELFTDDRIGMTEKYMMMDEKITMEFALNRHFGTTFSQPNGVTHSTVRSTIYIDDNQLAATTFYMSPSNFNSSTMYPSSSSAYMNPIGIQGGFYSNSNYTVWVPTWFMPQIPGMTQSVINFVNKYNYYSITFDVKTY